MKYSEYKSHERYNTVVISEFKDLVLFTSISSAPSTKSNVVIKVLPFLKLFLIIYTDFKSYILKLKTCYQIRHNYSNF